MEFEKKFNKMTNTQILIELKSVQEPDFSLKFVVNFSKMGFLGDDLSTIKPFDFPLIVLKFTPPPEFKYSNEYYSTDKLTFRLVESNLLTFSPNLDQQRKQVKQ